MVGYTNSIYGKTIPAIYLNRIKASGPKVAFITISGDKTMSWNEVNGYIRAIYNFLCNQNLRRLEKVAIISQSRPEWIMTDIAIQCAQLVTVPIYPNNTIEDVSYILSHSDSKLIFLEDSTQYEKIKKVFLKTSKEVPIVIFDAPNNLKGALSFKELISSYSMPVRDFEDSAKSVNEDDPFSIVYTSGTTGVPKGVVLTQKNIVSEISSVICGLNITENDVSVTFLPFAHILGRVESLACVYVGFAIGFAENINKVAEAILKIKPTILVSVPRIYEKIFIKIKSAVEESSSFKTKLFNWAVAVGRKVAREKSNNKGLSPILFLKHLVADKLVFTKIREKMGGRLKLTISGGAALNAELCEFFHACGIKILEGYGLTETTAAIAVNRPDNYGFGTVGLPIDGVEIKIAEDGEILVRGNVVFKEYYNDPLNTKNAFKDGWFLTGDIGYIDEKGRVVITDRKKDIIVTSGGKNIAPQKIENMLRNTKFISQAMVWGDGKPYLVALITLNEAEILDWAKNKAIKFQSIKELICNKEVEELIRFNIEAINGKLANFETIKRFRILPCDFAIDAGELTPSLKIKRKTVYERYKVFLEEMYS